ncbi:MAG TPA: hypothetical protein VF792_07330 [Ktedonobacterales bacterium]
MARWDEICAWTVLPLRNFYLGWVVTQAGSKLVGSKRLEGFLST